MHMEVNQTECCLVMAYLVLLEVLLQNNEPFYYAYRNVSLSRLSLTLWRSDSSNGKDLVQH